MRYLPPERSTFCWYIRDTPAALRDRLARIGCTKVYLKAGGDNGVAWVPNSPKPPWGNDQWRSETLRDMSPLAVVPWIYNWPTRADIDVWLTILSSQWSDEIVLNPESEWRVQSNQNSFRTLTDANNMAEVHVNEVRLAIRRTFGREVRIGYSAVPSWTDFPIEGFEKACDFSLPQHYWFPDVMANGEDQIAAHIRRAGLAKPCVPILTACGEHDDRGVVRLAANALARMPVAGFSAWEAGNNAFQASAMAEAYRLLPEHEPERTDAVTDLRLLLHTLGS
jgi:hypothetical protein